MYLKNCWYVAAGDHELGDAPLARTILDEPVVFFRDGHGVPAALEDRCSHRHAPLSNGTLDGDGLRCGYHGLLFGRDGECREVQGQSTVPPGASVRGFPVIERYRWIWIWMGDPAQADEALIPDYHWNDDPEWVSQGDRFYVGGGYRLLVDNLLDLSHVQYIHASTLGAENVVDFPGETRRDGELVHVDRWIMGGPPPPMFKTAGGITGDVDRWQLITWNAPGHVVIDVGCAPAGILGGIGVADHHLQPLAIQRDLKLLSNIVKGDINSTGPDGFTRETYADGVLPVDRKVITDQRATSRA